jgi:hypothetical protein
LGKGRVAAERGLILYARQLAWLHATPKPPPESKRTEGEVATISRYEQMENDGIPIQMPPNPAPTIAARWLEIGTTEAAGMGAGPLSWGTIKAWQDVTGIALDRWEARLLRKLSQAYLRESRLAESENYPAPWHGEVTERERELELARLEMVLG